jgi:hypothetical protein
MRKLVLLLLVVLASVSAFAQTPDALPKAKKRGMHFADLLAEHKGALILINDKEYLGKIEDINADSVDQISFIQGEDAAKIYGKKATKGAFLLTYKEPPLNDNDLILPLPKNKLLLYILDGKVVTREQSEAVNPVDIADYTHLHDLVSISKYGKAGENGVVIITTKAAAKQKSIQKEKTN